jgi:aldehyde dehydrogenase (NAD+)
VITFDQLFIGGEWTDPIEGRTLDVLSPHSGELIGRSPAASPRDVDTAVAAAVSVFEEGTWRRTSVEDRITTLSLLADRYRERMMEIADVVSQEMGTPISFSNVSQGPGAWAVLDSFLGAGRAYEWEEIRPGYLGSDVIVRSEPVGVVGAIVPWNAPQFLTMSKLAPALLAGCSIVIKSAPETPLDALILAQIVHEVGLPKGVVSILPGGGEVGEHLVRHPNIDKVAFTGSTATGRRIASICGEQLKRVSLELGGKSAAIVLDDADVAATVAGLKFASFMNSGEACVAQTRIVVQRKLYEQLLDGLADMVSELKVGDPADPDTEIGPMVSSTQQSRVDGYIRLGIDEGARLAVGGSGSPKGLDQGWYVRPTLFADVDNGMRIAQEEIFGPVLAVIPCDDDADAIRIANDSPYGLGGSVWTSDNERGLDVARQVRTGTLAINRYSSDFAAPFGGFKASGIGRENGKEGIAEYVELKSIAL